ncbi:reverse transcriptase domain-containing protein [Tanacetum coccineum]
MANPDDEPMWAVDHVVAPTPGPAITIRETANEFTIKGNHLTLIKGKPIRCKTFSWNALADLGASINLMSYYFYAKLSLETPKPTKISVRLADRSFQYPVGIAENMPVEVGKFTFPVDFVILEMEEDRKVPLILGRHFLHTADAIIRKSLDEPPTDLELKPLLDHREYAFLEEPSFLPVIISSQLSKQNKNKLISVLKRHKCMLAIFQDMIKESVEIFMDDFFVFEKSFDNCLNNLDKMLIRCKDASLVLNWEKYHFIVKEGIILGHKLSTSGLEVDKAKIDLISKLPPPLMLKALEVFLGHAGFYRRFIKGFSKTVYPLTKLLKKDTSFNFDDECHKAFNSLKKLTCTPIIMHPNWNLPFELMCDAIDFAVGAVLGQKDGNISTPSNFASKTLNAAQQNYTVTEKELIDVTPLQKARRLTMSHTLDIAIAKILYRNKRQKMYRQCHRCSLITNWNDETSDDDEINDNFPGETLMEISTKETPWLADFAKYLVGDIVPKRMTYQ